jgi:hypothetical protein
VQQQIDDALRTTQEYECGECGFSLKIQITDGAAEAVCSANANHTGQRAIETLDDAVSREVALARVSEAQLAISPVARQEEVGITVALLADKYQMSTGEANTFYAFCGGLPVLDTFLGDIIPLVFRSKQDPNRRTVTPFITKKGWSTLAQCAEPDEFMGPPSLERIKGEAAEDIGYGSGDIVFKATGRKKSWPAPGGEVISAFTLAEITEARQRGTVSGHDPVHHAMVRAVRRWYEDNYPAARSSVAVAAKVLPAEVIEVIEGEYRIVDAPASSQKQRSEQQKRASSIDRYSGPDRDSDNDAITPNQTRHILKIIGDAWGWNEEDLSRDKLDDAPLDSLTKSQASQLIDQLKQDTSQGGAQQGSLGD